MGISTLNHWIGNNIFLILSGNLLLVLLLFVYIIAINKKLKKYRYLFKGNENIDLNTLLLNTAEKVHVVQASIQKLEESFTANQIYEAKHFQKWNLLRFKAFENTGGDQSFALAILDEAGDGFVLSSIFGREESRVYCKPVQKGVSSYALSTEEKESIQKALGESKK